MNLKLYIIKEYADSDVTPIATSVPQLALMNLEEKISKHMSF